MHEIEQRRLLVACELPKFRGEMLSADMEKASPAFLPKAIGEYFDKERRAAALRF
jgi:hypothetical protein